MNFLIILGALWLWRRSHDRAEPLLAGPTGLLTCIIASIGLLALEAQLVTWWPVANLRTLPVPNTIALVVAAAAALRRRRSSRVPGAAAVPPMPWAAVALMAALVLALNTLRPLAAADPYHLERIAQIERLGMLQYDLASALKANLLWTYELLLADLRQVPGAGPTLVRLHGLLGLALYVIGIAAARTWLGGGRRWCWAALLVVPAVFHQFVQVKNDLFSAAPALVVLVWLVMRGETAPPRETAWAAWLSGFAIAVKLTMAPLGLVMLGALVARRADRWRSLRALAFGGVAGLIAGGLGFALVENARWYGDAIAPFQEAGGADNRNTTIVGAAIGVTRFAISLFDLGLVTRWVWPGRGGWGATYGLPFVWALAVMAARFRDAPEARRASWIAGGYLLTFAAVYTDADLAHRLALGPGLMLICVAVHLTGGDDRRARNFRWTLAAFMALSAAQLLRSAMLYLS